MHKPLLSLRCGLWSSETEEEKSAVADVVVKRLVIHAQGEGAECAASQKLCYEEKKGNTTEEQVDWATEIAFHFKSEASVTGLEMEVFILVTSYVERWIGSDTLRENSPGSTPCCRQPPTPSATPAANSAHNIAPF